MSQKLVQSTMIALFTFCLFPLQLSAGSGQTSNHVAISGGGVYAHHHIDPVVGVEYARTVGKKHFISILGGYEFIYAKYNTHAIFAGIGIMPWKGSKLILAPLLEIYNHHVLGKMRVGAGYDFHIGPVATGPLFAVDFHPGHTTLLGSWTIGLGF